MLWPTGLLLMRMLLSSFFFWYGTYSIVVCMSKINLVWAVSCYMSMAVHDIKSMLIFFSLLTFVCRYGLELAAYPVWPFHSVHHMVQLPCHSLSVPSLSLSLSLSLTLSLSQVNKNCTPRNNKSDVQLIWWPVCCWRIAGRAFLSGIHCGTEASDQYLIIITRRYTLPPRLLQWSEEVHSDTVLSYNKHGCVHLSSSSCIQKCSDF